MRTKGTRKKLGSRLTLYQYQMCYTNGSTALDSLRHIPAEVRDLLIRKDAIAKGFKENIRTHNIALSFTSKYRIDILI